MKSKTIECFSFEPDQQRLKHVNPGERPFTDKSMLIDSLIEVAFSSTLHRLSITRVLRNVRNHPMIPQHFARFPRIKTSICIEEGAFVVQPTALHGMKELLQLLLQLIAIVMVASNELRGRNNVPFGIGYGQNVAGLCPLASLIGDRIAPFFAALWLPSRLISDKFNSPLIVMILASKSFCKLPSLLHFRK